MRILVTGGTGFVGSHATAALVRAGHDVRLLVRDPRRIAPALAPHGIHGVEHRIGDVLDERAVANAMDRVDAVLHAAAVYSVRRWHAGRVRRTNVRAAEIVLGHGVRAGLDPVVHVSSYSAGLPSRGSTLVPGGPLSTATWPYVRSKAESERVARRHQDAGAPVVVVSPGMVWGPHDPHRGESTLLARDIVRRRLPFRPAGGVPLVDVRDLAEAIAAVFEPGRSARSYLLGGRHVALEDLVAGLGAAPVRPAPRWLHPALGTVMEAFRITLQDPRTDDTLAERELGFVPRPTQETLDDTVRWMAAAGLVRPHVASQREPSPV
jgi:dihydroflavonol-4-reductase